MAKGSVLSDGSSSFGRSKVVKLTAFVIGFALFGSACGDGDAVTDSALSPSETNSVSLVAGPSTSVADGQSIADPQVSTPQTIAPPLTSAPQSLTDAPSTQPPPTAAPTTQPPTTAAPATRPPATAAPTTRPATTAPATVAPTVKAPTTAAPTTKAPTTAAPTTAAPTTKAPTTAAPTTAAPTTKAPTTAAPTTAAPATQAPTTKAPTTAAPATQAPTTAAPATQAPTTAAPTTAAPATQAPTTAAPATTAGPTTAAPTTAGDAGGNPDGGQNGDGGAAQPGDSPETTNPAPSNEPPKPGVIRLTASGGTSASSAMMADGESIDKIIDEQRRFSTNSLIKIEPVNEKQYSISNFIPVNLTDVKVYAHIEGHGTVLMTTVEAFDGLRNATLTYPWVEGRTSLENPSGQTVDLSALAGGIDPAKITFSYESTDDTLRRLDRYKLPAWSVKPHNYNTTQPDSFSFLYNPDAEFWRRWMALVINFAYVTASPEFKEAFLATPESKNDKTMMTQEEIQAVYDKMFVERNLRIGVTGGNPAGWGGGSTWAVSRTALRSGLAIPHWWSITSHEFGHVLGFGHSSSMTSSVEVNGERRGYTLTFGKVLQDFMDKDELPVRLDNYFMPSDYPDQKPWRHPEEKTP